MATSFRVSASSAGATTGPAHVQTFSDFESATAHKEQLIAQNQFQASEISIEPVQELGIHVKP